MSRTEAMNPILDTGEASPWRTPLSLGFRAALPQNTGLFCHLLVGGRQRSCCRAEGSQEMDAGGLRPLLQLQPPAAPTQSPPSQRGGLGHQTRVVWHRRTWFGF